MDYQTALAAILSLPDMERSRGQAGPRERYDLTRMVAFLERLGNPQRSLPAIHVAGTKGKGSVAAMIAAILTAAGYPTGLYTSPHLHTFRERLRLNGEPITEAAFAGLVARLLPAAQLLSEQTALGEVTTFEFLTAMAFQGFADADCQYQVLEVGLGGRLDATNVLERPLLSIITSISLDHTQILGNTLEQIAADKAGILKPGRPAVIAPQTPEVMATIRSAARDRRAPLTEVGPDYTWQRLRFDLEGQAFRISTPAGPFEGWIPLLGQHQLENAACVLAACRLLQAQGVQIPDRAIAEGFRRVRWPGRLEVLRRVPLVVVDGAHNPYSAARLGEAVAEYLPRRRLILVFGVSADKDLAGMVRHLAPITAMALVCRSRHPRSRPTAEVATAFADFGVSVRECRSVQEAVEEGMQLADAEDLVLGTGSLYAVAEMREALLSIPAERYPA